MSGLPRDVAESIGWTGPIDETLDDDGHDPEPASRRDTEAEVGQSAAALERRGLGYALRLPGLELSLAYLRQSRDGLGGELTVTRRGTHLLRANFNVSSLSARTTAARELAKRTEGAPIPWPDILERLCVGVLTAARTGEPIVEVGQGPLSIRAVAYRCQPTLRLDKPTIWYGQGGAGKTTLAAGVGVSVAAGVEVIPGWSPAQAPVLILDWENDADEWNTLIGAVAAGVGIAPPAIGYRYGGARSLAEQLEELAGYVREREVGLVIVDSSGGALGAARDGSDANETVLRMFAALRELRTTALLIDHVAGTELGAAKPSAKPYGSVYKVNAARDMWQVSRERSSPDGNLHLALTHTKTNRREQPPIGLRVEWDDAEPARWVRFVPEEIATPELVGATVTGAERIRRYLLEVGAADAASIADDLDMAAPLVRAYLSRGSRGGVFVKLPNKLWVVPDLEAEA